MRPAYCMLSNHLAHHMDTLSLIAPPEAFTLGYDDVYVFENQSAAMASAFRDSPRVHPCTEFGPCYKDEMRVM